MIPKQNEVVRQAETFAAQGEVASAIALYRRFLARNPDDWSTQNRVGDLLARTGDSQGAIKAFGEAARGFHLAGFIVKSIAIYKKVIKLDPARLDTYEKLAELYHESGLQAEAVTQYQALAIYYRKRGELAKARGLEGRIELLQSSQPFAKEAEQSVSTGNNLAMDLPVVGVPIIRAPVDMTVFLCHASEDKPAVRNLYGKLKKELMQPWLDEEDLLPGQNWEIEIEKAVRRSHAVAVCLSRRAVSKSGFVHKELRFALEVLEHQPEGIIFIIPVRLEDCEIPYALRPLHYVDLFEDRGYERLLRALEARAGQLGFR